MLATVFGPSSEWPNADLIALSQEFDADLTLAAYRSGVFPMPLHLGGFEGRMAWWSPVRRGILPLGGLVVSRSLRQSAKNYTTSVDAAFDGVLDRCADPRRPGGWIDPEIKQVYVQLRDRGFVHSVETWDRQGRLVGGLYGVSLNGLFAGESMFHDPEHGRDASKVALLRLVEELSRDGLPRLLDVQWRTDHLGSLGAIEVSRPRYLALLDAALSLPPVAWSEERRHA